MLTWWIVRVNGYNPIITVSNLGHLYRSAIGPYFTYKEAMNVLHIWSKQLILDSASLNGGTNEGLTLQHGENNGYKKRS